MFGHSSEQQLLMCKSFAVVYIKGQDKASFLLKYHHNVINPRFERTKIWRMATGSERTAALQSVSSQQH